MPTYHKFTEDSAAEGCVDTTELDRALRLIQLHHLRIAQSLTTFL